MHKLVASKLSEYVERGRKIGGLYQLDEWRRKVYGFLEGAYETDLLAKLQSFEVKGDTSQGNWPAARDKQVHFLEGQVILFAEDTSTLGWDGDPGRVKADRPNYDLSKVFLVHGHDEAAKELVARFLERIGLTVVILHEQPNEGRTVIEKFEHHSKVGFAVVLLTPDDVGGSARTPEILIGRARQNVVLELGYFTGVLGRKRVCGLYRPGVEVPSDFHGVLLTELDAQGAWKTKLAQELVSASMKINIQALLQG